MSPVISTNLDKEKYSIEVTGEKEVTSDSKKIIRLNELEE